MKQVKTDYEVGDRVALASDVLQLFQGEVTAIEGNNIWVKLPGCDPQAVTPQDLVEAWDEK